jgi:predicted nuclease with TOPRIM domain
MQRCPARCGMSIERDDCMDSGLQALHVEHVEKLQGWLQHATDEGQELRRQLQDERRRRQADGDGLQAQLESREAEAVLAAETQRQLQAHNCSLQERVDGLQAQLAVVQRQTEVGARDV